MSKQIPQTEVIAALLILLSALDWYPPEGSRCRYGFSWFAMSSAAPNSAGEAHRFGMRGYYRPA
jgi:hypothetical protein